jgi:hypothetical protein
VSTELRRRVLKIGAAVIVLLLLLNGGAGFLIFSKEPMDPMQSADAIVVLAGEHDGREDYAIELARDGWAPVVVLSNPYPFDDPLMKRVCEVDDSIEVLCPRPAPATTRGEADLTRRLAVERSWTKVIVVTWNFHIRRARLVFRQCFSSNPDSVIMRAVPRRYGFSVARWELTYAYQFAATAKAVAQGDCLPAANFPEM